MLLCNHGDYICHLTKKSERSDAFQMLEITISALVSFVTMSTLLTIYSIFDFRDRLVPNQTIFAGAIIGFVVVLISGHLIQHLALHLTAAAIMIILGYTLFRIGSFGGADFKVTLIVAIVSPGLEFTSWSNPILEGILIAGLQLIVMLAGGYVYSKRRVYKENMKTIPLIPLLFGAYLILQLLAIF